MASRSYKLALVNGRDVPAVWRESIGSEGSRVRSLWTGGVAVFRENGAYSVQLDSALQVGYRAEPVGPHAFEGSWRRVGDDQIELYSVRGTLSRWQISRDLSVLVASVASGAGTGDCRTIFTFVRD